MRQGIEAILNELTGRARDMLANLRPQQIWAEIYERYNAGTALNELLTRWGGESNKPLVLLIDEIDSLVGDTLISVLRQLRAGYDKRPALFPQSVILCGVRDVRDVPGVERSSPSSPSLGVSEIFGGQGGAGGIPPDPPGFLKS